MPKTSEERKAYLREYHQRHREHLRELKKRYYEENKQYLYEISKETKAARRAELSAEELEVQRQKHREAVARSKEKYADRYREAARVREAEKRASNPEKHRAAQKAYVERNREKISAQSKARRARNPERERVRDGMVFAPGQTIASLREEQGGLCAICRRPLPDGMHTHVDHCHTYAVADELPNVRGLLCRGCNIGLGAFEDNPQFLRWATDYAEARQAKLAALRQAKEAEIQPQQEMC